MNTITISIIAICLILLLVARGINKRTDWKMPHCFGDKQLHASGWYTDPCRQCEYFSECIRITRSREGAE